MYLVGVWNEVNYRKVPALIRGRLFAGPLGHVGHYDFRSRHGVPLRVRHRTNNAAVYSLTQRRARSKAKRETKNKNPPKNRLPFRSEEHTSELQSHLNLVCRLLLEKKKSV